MSIAKQIRWGSMMVTDPPCFGTMFFFKINFFGNPPLFIGLIFEHGYIGQKFHAFLPHSK